MFKRTWIKFLATVSVSGALAKAIGDSFIKIDELAKRIEELEAKNENLADLACEQQTETYEYRHKLKKMHRRAQRAEASQHRAIVEATQPYIRERDDWQKTARNFESKLNQAERFLKTVYPLLHFAWLHSVGSKPWNDSNKAYEIATIEAQLRDVYRGIEIPPKPERWSDGK